MITESLARSLTTEELAQRLADEGDDFMRYFARRVLDGDIEKENEEIQRLEGELQEAESGSRYWQEEAEDFERLHNKFIEDVRAAIKSTEDRDSLVDALEEFL